MKMTNTDKKCIANIIVNLEKLYTFLLRLGMG